MSVVANFIATQYIAARFQYQPALGSPLLRSAPACGIYQPFSWTVWGWRYCTSQDPRIRQPLFEGEMIVFARERSFASAFFFVPPAGARAAVRERRRPARIGAMGRPKTTFATPVCSTHEARRLRRRLVRRQPRDTCTTSATTVRSTFSRSRRRAAAKASGLVIPTLLAWEESAVIYDIKGENWAKTAGFRCQQGHLCFKFSPVEDRQFVALQSRCAEVRLFTRAM